MAVVRPAFIKVGGGTTTADADDVIVNLRISRRVIDSDYTIDEADSFVALNHSSPITLTIASSFISEENRLFEVKDETGNASLNNVTIKTEGNETIDGNNEIVLDQDFQAYQIYTDGSDCYII